MLVNSLSDTLTIATVANEVRSSDVATTEEFAAMLIVVTEFELLLYRLSDASTKKLTTLPPEVDIIKSAEDPTSRLFANKLYPAGMTIGVGVGVGVGVGDGAGGGEINPATISEELLILPEYNLIIKYSE